MLVLGIPGLIVLIVVTEIFYVLTLYKTLSKCSPDSRAMPPIIVWLLLIPFFNLIWNFFVVIAVSKSLQNEYVKRNINESPTHGLGVGLAMCILFTVSYIPLLGSLSTLAVIAATLFWIVYWIKIADYSTKLSKNTINQNGIPVVTNVTHTTLGKKIKMSDKRKIKFIMIIFAVLQSIIVISLLVVDHKTLDIGNDICELFKLYIPAYLVYLIIVVIINSLLSIVNIYCCKLQGNLDFKIAAFIIPNIVFVILIFYGMLGNTTPGP